MDAVLIDLIIAAALAILGAGAMLVTTLPVIVCLAVVLNSRTKGERRDG
jgi:hypothetical protein